jgi:hypothetical protein
MLPVHGQMRDMPATQFAGSRSARGLCAVLAIGLALGAGVARAGATCISNGDCAGSTVCLWSDAATWNDCGGATPGSGVRWTIEAGDTVDYDIDGVTTGGGALEGTLRFSESDAGRDPLGFRTLTIQVPAGQQSDLRIGSAGALVLRRGSRLLFDTTSGRWGSIEIVNGGLFDSQGSVWWTTIADIEASDADTSTCGTEAGRKYAITPADGIDAIAGTYLDRRVLHRRLVFLSGKLKSRHYEIVSTDDPVGSQLTVCTDLADERSHGQRLTPHVAVGAELRQEARHSVPQPSSGSSANDPTIGDAIAIVEDAWIGEVGGERGWRMIEDGAGLDPLPVVQATNLADFGAAGVGGIAAQFVPRSPGQPVPDFVFNNMHDGTSDYGIVFKAYHDSQVRWNALHDYARSEGNTNNYCLLNLHQNKTIEHGEHGLFNGPTHDVDVSDNVGYRVKQCVIQVNDGGNFPNELILDYQARGMLVRRNLLFSGCANLQGDSPCFALNVNSCRDCDVAHNVVYDICQGGGTDGRGIYLGGDAGNEGTSVRENWVVNTCGGGIVLSDGDTPPCHLDSVQQTTVVHNYISNVRGPGGQGGIWIGNIIKNFGVDNPDGTWALVNPIKALSNVIFVDESLSARRGTGEVCDAETSKCALGGIVFFRGHGNQNACSVMMSDLLVGPFSRAAIDKFAVGIGHSFFDPDYEGEISHLTVDGHQNGMLYGVHFRPNGSAEGPRRWAIDDIACTNKNGAECIRCTAKANWEEVAGQVHTVVSGTPQENGGIVSAACFDSGTTTTSATLNYQSCAGYDYNFIGGAPQLTAGASPPGSPIGIRAFRFDRARMNGQWGGALSFDGAFPADIANVPHDDTDVDGVIDLFDNCPRDFNPGQLDEDADGFAICGGDCDDSDASVGPGQPEVCDGLDNDCRGSADDLDGDGDGHSGCLDDCDDASATTHPGADEICNGIDDDCDALVDDDGDEIDADVDGVSGACDNCPGEFNPGQEDGDGDGQGDLCDLDDGLILVRWLSSTTLAWQAEEGFTAANLYCGDLEVLKAAGIYTQDPALVPLASRTCGLISEEVAESDTPGPDQVMFFLVTGVSAAGESTLGADSSGRVRPNDNPCQ